MTHSVYVSPMPE